MEVGAVKQAFNNEVILMKKNLNQAKIQVIHKLTRKAKTLTEKKAPEKIQQKLKKKADSAVKEVLIIKKIKAKDLAKFIVTHKGELNSNLNKPEVDQDKACARLLLHKSLQGKYKSIRDRFGNTSIEDLLMSRLERRKIKKEAREKQKNKKKGKEGQNKVVNGGSTWKVEDIDKENPVNGEVGVLENHDHEMEDDDHSVASESSQSNDEVDNSNIVTESDNYSEHEEISVDVPDNIQSDIEIKNVHKNSNSSDNKTVMNPDVKTPNVLNSKLGGNKNSNNMSIKSKIDVNKKESKISKKKDLSKNKNFNEKILKRKFNKITDEKPVQEVKVVDPFFITSTGDNYISVVEPRQPDEVKDIHKEGNRKYRRAVMFGHIPKPKPRKDNDRQNNRKFGHDTNSNNRMNKANDDHRSSNNLFKRKEEEHFDKDKTENVEKLHPSWAAKKKVSTLLPFEGRKTVFNDDD